MKKMLFVFNPVSGKAQIKNKLLDILKTFSGAEYSVEVYPTRKRGETAEIVKARGAEFERVVVSGGDGTLNECINGLASIERDKRPIIGYIPTGTTNDFASNLKIPKDMLRAAQLVIDGELFSCDIGCFNEKRFLYVAAFGAFTDIPYETPQMNKNYLGHLAYLLEGTKKLHTLKSYKLTVEANDELHSGEYIFGMVSNSNYVAGINMRSKLHAALNDGLFEIMLIKYPKNLIDFQMTVSDLLTQNLSSERFEIFRTSRARFMFESEVPWTLDGEFGGSVDTAEVSIENSGVCFLSGVPESESRCLT